MSNNGYELDARGVVDLSMSAASGSSGSGSEAWMSIGEAYRMDSSSMIRESLIVLSVGRREWLGL